MGGPNAGLPKPRNYNVEEGFFVDEMNLSKTTPNGLHPNRLLSAGRIVSVASMPVKLREPFINPLGDPEKVDVLEDIPQTKEVRERRENLVIFAPNAALGAPPPIKVTLFFSVDGEIMRFGLRSFFEGTDTVLILLPAGREGSRNWGVGITPEQIALLFNEVGLGGKPFSIKTLAAFSAGYRGLTGVVNNTLGRSFGPNAGPPRIQTGHDLSKVETVIFYDAFYSTKLHIQNAIDGLNKTTGGGVNVVVYDVTDGGTPRSGGALQVPLQTLLPANRFSVIDIKQSAAELALVFARAFEGAIKDEYIALTDAPTEIQDLLNAGLPKRGTMASKSPLAPFRRVPTSVTTLDSWAKANAGPIASFLPKAEAVRQKFLADTERFNWMGWGPPDIGQVRHNGFIQEYGWEFLAG